MSLSIKSSNRFRIFYQGILGSWNVDLVKLEKREIKIYLFSTIDLETFESARVLLYHSLLQFSA